MIHAVVFDLDGVLVDAVDWHFTALNQALSLLGFQIGQAEHEQYFNGLPTYVKLRLLSERNGLPRSLHPFINEMKQRFTVDLLKMQCKPSLPIQHVLETLSQRGYKLAVCSNSTKPTVELILKLMGLRDYFEIVLSTNDVKNPKPNPEIYQLAFSLLRLKPEECLVIEDSEPGIQSATESDAHLLKVMSPNDVTLDRIERAIYKVDGLKRGSKATYPPVAPLIEIIIPMAGMGTRFSQAGFKDPKPLIPVLDRPMIQWVIENVRPRKYKAHFTFICCEDHLKSLDVGNFLRSLEPTCSIVPVKNLTAGAACTVLLAGDSLSSSRPVLIANSDQFLDFEIDGFLEDAFQSKCDGSIITFESRDPKWSYAKLDAQNEYVIRVAEKEPISNHATVGIYFFRRAFELANALQSMIRKNIRTNDEFYLCPVYNELVQLNKKIRVYEVPVESMHGLGTPEDLSLFIDKNREKNH